MLPVLHIAQFSTELFFLQADGYAVTSEATSLWTFIKTEPLSPITSDCSFAYASDIAEERCRKQGHVVELPF
jgi:hypothetical protein